MNFASDNWAGALPSVIEAVTRHNGGFARAYGGDEVTAAVTRTFREIFETDLDIHFVATGTAANSLSMTALTRPGGVVFCSSEAHLHNDEYNATEFLTGMKLWPVAAPAGKMTPDTLNAAIAKLASGRFGPPTALTLTNATECGTTYSSAEVGALAAIAKASGMAVHVDGARFGNAVAATRESPAALTWKAGVDIMSFGATKNGAMGAEAILVFNRERAADVQLIRQRAGHVVSKARFVAAQFEGYFAGGAWLAAAGHANLMAARLSAGIEKSNKARLAWTSTANEIFPVIAKAEVPRLREAGAMFYEWPAEGLAANEECLRLVTSFETTADDVDGFLALL